MAMPVEFRKLTPPNSRADLIRRLEQAPEDHAEALLSAYDLLQRLHEKGLLDIANGLLNAGETVVNRAVDVASSKETVAALRVMFMFGNLLKSLDPERIHDLLSAGKKKPPSIWAILKQAFSDDGRRGLAATIGLLNLFGALLRKQT